MRRQIGSMPWVGLVLIFTVVATEAIAKDERRPWLSCEDTIYGARRAEELYCADVFERIGVRLSMFSQNQFILVLILVFAAAFGLTLVASFALGALGLIDEGPAAILVSVLACGCAIGYREPKLHEPGAPPAAGKDVKELKVHLKSGELIVLRRLLGAWK